MSGFCMPSDKILVASWWIASYTLIVLDCAVVRAMSGKLSDRVCSDDIRLDAMCLKPEPRPGPRWK